MKEPTVTVAIPTLNEENHIEDVVRTFLTQTYKHIVQILVVDGGSTDGTVEIVKRLAEKDTRVKLLHNPERIQSVALNVALRHGKGDLFLRADAHCIYASDYVEMCVEVQTSTGAINVGGAQRFIAVTPFQAAVALATKSMLGSGGARYRNSAYEGYVDTVFLGCFLRDRLLEIGGYADLPTNEDAELNVRLRNVFDTAQVINQDFDLNVKLRKLNDQCIYLSPKIKVWYYPRRSWTSLVKQYFRYGRGTCLTASKHKQNIIRAKLPFFCFATICVYWFIDLATPGLNLYSNQIAGFVLAAIFLESLRIGIVKYKCLETEIWRGEREQQPGRISMVFLTFVVFVSMSIPHAAGRLYQGLKMLVVRKRDW